MNKIYAFLLLIGSAFFACNSFEILTHSQLREFTLDEIEKNGIGDAKYIRVKGLFPADLYVYSYKEGDKTPVGYKFGLYSLEQIKALESEADLETFKPNVRLFLEVSNNQIASADKFYEYLTSEVNKDEDFAIEGVVSPFDLDSEDERLFAEGINFGENNYVLTYNAKPEDSKFLLIVSVLVFLGSLIYLVVSFSGSKNS